MRITREIKGRRARYNPATCELTVRHVTADSARVRLDDEENPEGWMEFHLTRDDLAELLAEMDAVGEDEPWYDRDDEGAVWTPAEGDAP